MITFQQTDKNSQKRDIERAKAIKREIGEIVHGED